MKTLDQLISEFRNDAETDIISFPYIVGNVQYGLELTSELAIRTNSLKVVRGLMDQNVYPGDIDGITVQFWPGTSDDILQRIEREWLTLGKVPDLGHWICWFDLKPASQVGEYCYNQ